MAVSVASASTVERCGAELPRGLREVLHDEMADPGGLAHDEVGTGDHEGIGVGGGDAGSRGR